MSRDLKQSISGRDKLNEIVQGFIHQLEQGAPPWIRPYSGSGLFTLPQNGYSKRPYQGINIVVLWDAMNRKGYESPHWYTYRQAEQLNAHVKRGERGTSIIFWEMREKENQEPDKETGEIKHYWFTRIYTVFNANQIEGLDVPQQEEVLPEEYRYNYAEEFCRKTGIKIITRKGAIPCYNTKTDIITMPPFKEFNCQEAYLATKFHELGHSSGAPHRLDRLQRCKFGDHTYAFEELVADLTAAFLGAHFQVPIQKVQHAEYLGHWVNALKEKPQILWSASAKAQQAHNYLLKLGGEVESFGQSQETSINH